MALAVAAGKTDFAAGAGGCGVRLESAAEAFQVASTLVGAVIGAGFASGQEVVSFFDPLAGGATVGLGLAAAVLAGGSLLVVRTASALRAGDYGSLFRLTAGPGLGALIDAVVSAFLFLTMAVTLAGGAAILRGAYGIPPVPALALASVGSMLMATRGPTRLFRTSAVLVPVLVAVLLLVVNLSPAPSRGRPPGGQPVPDAPALLQAGDPRSAGEAPVPGMLDAAASGALYGSYNLVLGVGVLVAGARYRGRRPALAGAALGGVGLGALAARMLSVCRAAGPEVLAAQVPVAALARRGGQCGVHLYAVAVGLAALTTAGCIALSLAERCRLSGRARGLAPAAVVVAAAPLASWGFARLVRTVYPALGLVGIVWLAIFVIRADRQE